MDKNRTSVNVPNSFTNNGYNGLFLIDTSKSLAIINFIIFIYLIFKVMTLVTKNCAKFH